jgi:hypothetical protein
VRLAEQERDQRVVEARAFRHSWAEIAGAVGIARQSAHRRWHGLDAAAAVLAEERERQFRPRQLLAATPSPPVGLMGEEGSDAGSARPDGEGSPPRSPLPEQTALTTTRGSRVAPDPTWASEESREAEL